MRFLLPPVLLQINCILQLYCRTPSATMSKFIIPPFNFPELLNSGAAPFCVKLRNKLTHRSRSKGEWLIRCSCVFNRHSLFPTVRVSHRGKLSLQAWARAELAVHSAPGSPPHLHDSPHFVLSTDTHTLGPFYLVRLPLPSPARHNRPFNAISLSIFLFINI